MRSQVADPVENHTAGTQPGGLIHLVADRPVRIKPDSERVADHHGVPVRIMAMRERFQRPARFGRVSPLRSARNNAAVRLLVVCRFCT
jgi:hypothetical protein